MGALGLPRAIPAWRALLVGCALGIGAGLAPPPLPSPLPPQTPMPGTIARFGALTDGVDDSSPRVNIGSLSGFLLRPTPLVDPAQGGVWAVVGGPAAALRHELVLYWSWNGQAQEAVRVAPPSVLGDGTGMALVQIPLPSGAAANGVCEVAVVSNRRTLARASATVCTGGTAVCEQLAPPGSASSSVIGPVVQVGDGPPRRLEAALTVTGGPAAARVPIRWWWNDHPVGRGEAVVTLRQGQAGGVAWLEARGASLPAGRYTVTAGGEAGSVGLAAREIIVLPGR